MKENIDLLKQKEAKAEAETKKLTASLDKIEETKNATSSLLQKFKQTNANLSSVIAVHEEGIEQLKPMLDSLKAITKRCNEESDATEKRNACMEEVSSGLMVFPLCSVVSYSRSFPPQSIDHRP